MTQNRASKDSFRTIIKHPSETWLAFSEQRMWYLASRETYPALLLQVESDEDPQLQVSRDGGTALQRAVERISGM